MKTIAIKLVSVLFMIAVIDSHSFAQSNFEKDFVAFHKKAIMTCGLIKKPEMHKKAEILQELKEFRTQLGELQKKYAGNPPEEYSNDPLWKSYFMGFYDIIDALQTRVEKENYKVAAMNCSRFCMLFDKIHTINGHLTLTDMMFRWFSQVTMTTNMVNAANYPGAEHNDKNVRELHKKVLEFKKAAKKSEEFNKEFKNIDKLYSKWLNALESNDYQGVSDTFKKFQGAFGKVFLMSL
jgi:soluble cytochrome b562